MEERKSFTFFRSYYDAMQNIDDPKVKADVFMAICAYALDGEVIPLQGIAAALFSLVKPNLDVSAKKAKAGQFIILRVNETGERIPLTIAGFDRKNANTIGLHLLADDSIKEAIKERRTELNAMIDDIAFEKEDLMRIYWEMFNEANKKGKLADARAILSDIARYNGVNPDEVKKEIAVLNFNLDGDKI